MGEDCAPSRSMEALLAAIEAARTTLDEIRAVKGRSRIVEGERVFVPLRTQEAALAAGRMLKLGTSADIPRWPCNANATTRAI